MNRFLRQSSLRQRSSSRRSVAIALLASIAGFVILATAGVSVQAQDRPAADSKGNDAKPAEGSAPSEQAPGALDESEASLERRYQQFERTLLQMAEYLRKTEPERADLLIRAIGRSKENRISQQMEAITQLLKKEQFGDAIGDQEHLVVDLKGLLELLQSEDRRHQLEQEKQYYENLHKEVSKLAAREKDLRGATERGGNLNRLAERQQGIRKDAQSLLDKIDKQDASRNGADSKSNRGKNSQKGDKNPSGDKKSDKDRNSDKKSDADKRADADKKADADKQADASSKQGDAKDKSKDKDGSKGDKNSKDGKNPTDSKGDKKSGSDKAQDQSKENDKSQQNSDKQSGSQDPKKDDSKKQQKQQGQGQQNQDGDEGETGEQQEGSPSEDSQPQDQKIPKKTPGRKEIEAARRAMEKAEEELKRLQGKKGMEREDEAIRKLAEARAQLERVLRQLREEEQQLILASLEARFAKMLVMELQIHVDTIALSKTQNNAWTVKHFGRARELSVEQEEIATEAAKALTLLKEEGSSVAFPQGVEQVRDDMLNIARRLSGNDVGEFTQSVERDVIESLEEMVTALQNEIEKRQKQDENRRQRGQRGQSDDEKQLVQDLAELKMLRSLQFRVNRRTKQIARLIPGEQASNDKLVLDLAKLARRQAEIQEATYILATGRNR